MASVLKQCGQLATIVLGAPGPAVPEPAASGPGAARPAPFRVSMFWAASME